MQCSTGDSLLLRLTCLGDEDTANVALVKLLQEGMPQARQINQQTRRSACTPMTTTPFLGFLLSTPC